MPLLDAALERALREWLEIADGDLDAAERLAPVPRHYRRVGFNAQQAIEKYAKAVLAICGVSFARTHDLLQLLSALYPAVQFSNVELEAAATLIPFAVVWRYPQDSDPDELPVSQLLDFAYLLRERLRPLIVAALA